jgi:hypothetical protein
MRHLQAALGLSCVGSTAPEVQWTVVGLACPDRMLSTAASIDEKPSNSANSLPSKSTQAINGCCACPGSVALIARRLWARPRLDAAAAPAVGMRHSENRKHKEITRLIKAFNHSKHRKRPRSAHGSRDCEFSRETSALPLGFRLAVPPPPASLHSAPQRADRVTASQTTLARCKYGSRNGSSSTGASLG